jgi:hypothetical protein
MLRFKAEALSTTHHSKQSKTSSDSSNIFDSVRKYIPALCYAPLGFMLLAVRLCVLLQYLTLVIVMPASTFKK